MISAIGGNAMDQPLHILLLGSGGREHALAWKLADSPKCAALHAAPGSDAISAYATCHALDINDGAAVVAFCRQYQINLLVIGPEDPLVSGVADAARAAGIATFGPGADGAQLEGSKGFTKDICAEYDIPTAGYERCFDAASAHAAAEKFGQPVVIKADGLAAGKGVIIAETADQATAAIDDIFSGRFGAAGASVVVEEFLTGPEASLFAITDGADIVLLPAAQDHKRAYDGDTGPNTGGMGAYAPAPVLTPELTTRAVDEIIKPTLKALSDKGISYRGVLYAGLMLTTDGPKLIEYNARFGDPECQILMALLQSDLVELLWHAATGKLATLGDISISDQHIMLVVMAALGYPGAYEKGSVIRNLDSAQEADQVMIFEAGTQHKNGNVLAHGGRVLNITATAPTIKQAQKSCYAALDIIDWPEGFFRKDIGHRIL